MAASVLYKGVFFSLLCYVSNVAAFENYSPTPNFIIFNTDEETDFKRIRERNFWISVEGTFES
jgi:hypothetical protein